MKVGLVALHYPRPEHRDEMISRVQRAAEVMAAAPGCLAVDCWVSEDHQAVVTTGQWDSEQALKAGFAAVRTPALTSITTSASPRPARSSNSPPHERLPGFVGSLDR
jgi:quinol monooxygenase YgiN